MNTNSHLFNALACLKFFLNSQQTMFFFPVVTKRVLEFFNLVWRVGVISGYKPISGKLNYTKNEKINTGGIVVYLRHGRYRHDTVWIETISSSSNPLTFKNLQIKLQRKLNNPFVFLLSTSFGHLSSEELQKLNLKCGGLLICKLF